MITDVNDGPLTRKVRPARCIGAGGEEGVGFYVRNSIIFLKAFTFLYIFRFSIFPSEVAVWNADAIFYIFFPPLTTFFFFYSFVSFIFL